MHCILSQTDRAVMRPNRMKQSEAYPEANKLALLYTVSIKKRPTGFFCDVSHKTQAILMKFGKSFPK